MAQKTSKAAERIEKAKKQYGLAEEKTDSLLMRLVDSRYTLAIVVAVCVGILGWVWWN